MTFMIRVEDYFKIRIPNECIDLENMMTIESVANLVFVKTIF